MMPTGAGIPVLVHHSIAPGEKIGPDLFEGHLRVLRESRLPALRPAELASARRGFLLTLDDGFADLWTHGLPLLRAYGIPALAFIIPSRTGEGPSRSVGTRAHEASCGQAMHEGARSQGAHPAFLRWSELQALEASGLVEIQSHSFEHRAGWCGADIRGFYLGRHGGGHWSLPQATGGDERLGIPLYPRKSALACRLYHDDPGIRDALAAWLSDRGGEAYVEERGPAEVRRELSEQAKRYLVGHPNRGRWETPEEREKRTVDELRRAREWLETRLGGRRDELCLPWGHYDAVTLDCAKRAGVRRIYTTARAANPAGRIGFLVHRFGPLRARNGAEWLRRRLWIHRSSFRAALYGALYLLTAPRATR